MNQIIFRLVLTIILSIQIIPALGQQADDPYLWLENIDDEKSLDWVRAQNKVTEKALKEKLIFPKIYEKNLEILNSNERIAYPSIKGDYLYNFWQDAEYERGILRRTTFVEYEKENPNWETVLNIDALNEIENEKWVYKGASWLEPDYNLCMVRLSRGGGDAVVMREFNTTKKEFVENGFYLPEAKGSVSWKDENTLMVSTDFGEGTTTTSGYPRISKIWKRGTDLTHAKTFFAGDSTDMGVWGMISNTPERQYEIAYQAITFYTHHVHVLENAKLVKLDIQEDAGFNGFFKNQLLIQLKSDWDIGGKFYKQGSLISINYDEFLKGSRNFTVIVEPDERSSIQSVSNTKNALLVNILSNVRNELYTYHFVDSKWEKEKVDAPQYGSISIASTSEHSDIYFFNYNSFLTPSSLYLSKPDDGKIKKVKSLPDFFDATHFKVQQFEAKSKDGTSIPYFIVHHKKLDKSGEAPTLLYGYGGFEISMRPRYSATIGTAWLERGGVYVVANIRGGGEFGPNWHQAALKENRQLAFDDFIAVAEDLIDRKITSPKHLGIQGGSNGGLLVGAVFTQRPELFNAVVCAVPLLDMKRYNKLLAGASWMGEYGDPDIPEEWAYIKKYSPYQNVFADKKYPKIFLTTTTRDDRVHPGHARKMAAKMEGQGHEVFYFENIEGGHGSGTTNKQRAYSSALIYTYLLSQLK